jgi:hypothetical protein
MAVVARPTVAEQKQLRALREEFGIYEHTIPEALGLEREKWESFVNVVDKAAKADHSAGCGSFDGRRSVRPLESYEGDHAAWHRSKMRQVLAVLMAAGLRVAVPLS